MAAGDDVKVINIVYNKKKKILRSLFSMCGGDCGVDVQSPLACGRNEDWQLSPVVERGNEELNHFLSS